MDAILIILFWLSFICCHRASYNIEESVKQSSFNIGLIVPMESTHVLIPSGVNGVNWCTNCLMKTLGYQMMARHQSILPVLGPYNCSIPVALCSLLSVCFEFCTLMEKNTTWNFIEFWRVMLPQILAKIVLSVWTNLQLALGKVPGLWNYWWMRW